MFATVRARPGLSPLLAAGEAQSPFRVFACNTADEKLGRDILGNQRRGRFASATHTPAPPRSTAWVVGNDDRRRAATASPQTRAKSLRTLVDATLAPDERGQRLSVRLVLRRVPQHARPLGSCSLIDLCGSAVSENDGGKRLVGGCQVQALQLQRPTCPADRAIFGRPPHHQVEHGAEIAIDCLAIPAGLAFLPSEADPGEILPQRRLGIGHRVLGGPVQSSGEAGRKVCMPSTFLARGSRKIRHIVLPRVGVGQFPTAWPETLSRRSGPWRQGSASHRHVARSRGGFRRSALPRAAGVFVSLVFIGAIDPEAERLVHVEFHVGRAVNEEWRRVQ